MAQRPIISFLQKLVSPKKKREAETPAEPEQNLTAPSRRQETGEITEAGFITPSPPRSVSESPLGPDYSPRKRTAWKVVKSALTPTKLPFLKASITKVPPATQAAKQTGAAKSKTVNISNAELVRATPTQLLDILQAAYEEKSKFIC
jgi:hypothetical protein